MHDPFSDESDGVTYRVRPGHWLFWLVVLGLVPAIVLALAWELLDEDPFVRPVFVLILVLWVVASAMALNGQVLPMFRTHVTLDRRGLSGVTDGHPFEIYWIEVVAANLFGRAVPWLWVATRKYWLSIPLRYLDYRRIWEDVRGHLGHAPVGQRAYVDWLEKQGYFEQLSQHNAEVIQNTAVPLRARQKWFTTALGWLGLLGFGGCAVCSLSLDDPEGAGMCACVLALLPASGMLLLILPATVEVDLDGVTRRIPFLGRHRIRWDEIERVEFTPDFGWWCCTGPARSSRCWGRAGGAGAAGMRCGPL